MRTSNKILLGTFLAILFIITAIHAAIFSKYKSKSFVSMETLHYERYNTYDIKGVESVLISGLQNVTIIPADTAKVEIEKNDNGNNKVRYQFDNGVLTIKGDTTYARNGNEPERVRSYQDVIIYLPQVKSIKSDFCELTINGGKPSNISPLAMELQQTSLNLGGWNRENDTSAIRFDNIDITKSNESSIDVSGKIIVKQLSMNLENSNFEDGGLNCDSLFINADNSSTIKINGKNLAKTKFSVKP
ncbi:MAG: DUF2807 domain-containing protein [Bacteroidota bacterium]